MYPSGPRADEIFEEMHVKCKERESCGYQVAA
jgi:hypothetical protein